MAALDLHLSLHPQQGIAFTSPATEILYGGAAGGGKSHLMRICAIAWALEISGIQIYLFRRISDDLVKNHIEGPKGLPALLEPIIKRGMCRIVNDEVRFWNKSKIFLCHCKDEKDRWKYLGAEIHVLLLDELTTFTDTIYRFLRARVRAVGLNIPEKYKGMFPRIMSGSNPGGIGHHWVKAMFIDSAVPLAIRPQSDDEGGMQRQFIPAKLQDNPSMTTDDPLYRQRLRGLGSPALVRAMEEGDWNVVAGAFFPEFSTELHVIRPFEIPKHWLRFRAIDWGSARPFSVGWYAVSDGELVDGKYYPRDALIKYREFYGCRPGPPNVGLKLTADQLAVEILDRELHNETTYTVIDPAAFAEDGGPSIAERMAMCGVVAGRADNTRVPRAGAMGGWDQLRQRLVGIDGRPLLYFFDTCVHTIRTLPTLQHDEAKPEDVNTDSEDHAPDETRYACMSRPWAQSAKATETKKQKRGFTFQGLIDAHEWDKPRDFEQRIH